MAYREDILERSKPRRDEGTVGDGIREIKRWAIRSACGVETVGPVCTYSWMNLLDIILGYCKMRLVVRKSSVSEGVILFVSEGVILFVSEGVILFVSEGARTYVMSRHVSCSWFDSQTTGPRSLPPSTSPLNRPSSPLLSV
jgi:hypothetical protein